MNLSLEEEVRKEFDEWFKAASVRDVDAVMSKIEHHAHSFEHQPLQYLGLGAIRRSCEERLPRRAGEGQMGYSRS